jgi:hypothetical protein
LAAFYAVLHAVAGAFDENGFGVVEETVEHGGGDKCYRRLCWKFGSKYDRTAFVALADDLEEQVGSALVDGKIADLVEEH